ncbi:MAG: NAD(P)H-hydrate dehydratase [Proteobacteria bacterium]|nr:NAD(P)H-hydrate dehydratase [Pseudomonadota bacterium]
MKNELLTTIGIRTAEAAFIAEGSSEKDLMERAGQKVVKVILAHFSPCRTLVVCGPGKNGGDAQVVARHLQENGWSVDIIFLSALPSFEEIEKALKQTDLIVDGLLGTGLSRPLEGEIQRLVNLMNARNKPIVSIDIPTGIDADSGASWGDAIQATLTVTFFRARPGHFLLPGRESVGELVIKDIGIPERLLPPTPYYLNDPVLWRKNLKEPQPADHKYTRGACLVVGNGGMPGALRLAAMAARRIGAGLVKITCKSEDYPILASTVWGDIIFPLKTAKAFLECAEDERFKALLWGTGALPKGSTREQALLLLSTKKPCVLDGGALSSFKGKTQTLIKHLHANAILTPHEGEFLRLFPHLAFLKNKAEKALKAALETGSIVVLKGYDTIIASPDGHIIINANAPATLATAGTGDVLAGLMTGLLAQGLPPFQAAAAAVWIHGEAANHKGLGLIAEDLLDQIPVVLQELSMHRP